MWIRTLPNAMDTVPPAICIHKIPDSNVAKYCITTYIVGILPTPTRHAYACQIGPFWQDTLDIYYNSPLRQYAYSPNIDAT